MLFYYATSQMYSIVIFTIEQLTDEHKGGEDRKFLMWEESRRLLWPEQNQQDAVFRETRAQAVAAGWPSCGCWLLQQRNGETLEDLEQRWSDSEYSIRASCWTDYEILPRTGLG